MNNNKKNKQLLIGHWNCFSIDNKKQILNKFLIDNNFDIFCLNETKLDGDSRISFDNYNIELKNRNKNGGGVAIIIKKGIEYKRIEKLEKFSLEVVVIEVKTNKKNINIISIYNPPEPNSNVNLFKQELFRELDNMKPFMLIGDFNCHSTDWYCSDNNTNGNKFSDLILEFNLNVLNNSKPTRLNNNPKKKSIIDLFIISNDLSDKFNYFKVYNDNLTSDHRPICSSFNLETSITQKNKRIIHVKRINWLQYQIELNNLIMNETSHQTNNNFNLQTEYLQFINIIEKATKNSTKTLTRKLNAKTLPKYIVDLIKIRKQLNNRYYKKKKRDTNIKQEINRLTSLIRNELNAIRESIWLNFCKSLDKTNKNSSTYWRKIKEIGSLETKESRNNNKKIPTLNYENKTYSNNEQKANLFGEILSNIFQEDPNNNFDQEHKTKIEKHLAQLGQHIFATRIDDQKYDNDFSLNELEECLKRLNKKAAPGPDKVNNKQLVNLSILGKYKLLEIINFSWRNSIVIQEWKLAQISMIEKKDDLHNPMNYRPISLTNCIVKLIERLIQNRLVQFLDANNVISDYQSGFRANRQTQDNLIYFAQKVYEAFDSDEKVCGIVFDIQKAFDKVWHAGLIYKLAKINTPTKIGNWIKEFLNNRKFQVKVEGIISKQYDISTSVPQGAILSPVLFAIYINDIIQINQYPNDKIKSLLFADDLFSFNRNKNINYLNSQMKRYLNDLELWLKKWRLAIAANKCSFTIYAKRITKELKNGKFMLSIDNKTIPINHSPKYLGVILDRNFNLVEHTNSIRSKCLKKLNIIKCLSYKQWTMKIENQIQVYKTLIRSCLEYASTITEMSEYNVKRLSGIQYQALRIIYKEKIKCSNQYLHDLSQVEPLEERLHQLSSNYLQKAIINKNTLINKLFDERINSAGETKTQLERINFL